MAKILIIGRYKENATEFGSAELMTEKLNKLGTDHEFFELKYSQLGFDIDKEIKVWDTLRNVELTHYDFVFVRDWFLDEIERVLTLSMWLEAVGIPFLNTEGLKNRSFSKLSQIMHMAINNISTTPTLNGDPEFILKQLKTKNWGYPLIVKKRGSSRGRDNFLANNETELKKIFEEYQSRGLAWKLLVQEFIPNDGDYRLIVYRGEIKLIIYRQRTGDHTHLNNTSQGGKAKTIKISELQKLPYFSQMMKAVTIICDRWGRDFTGVDVMLSDENYTVLEINNMPQIETGSFIDEKLQILVSIIEKEIELKSS